MLQTDISAWLGRTETCVDRIDLARAKALQATLGDTQHGIADGAPLPPLWHWIYFWKVVPPERLSSDGHPARGDFLPPITLPRRMWAGSRVSFPSPLPIGADAERRSRITRIAPKHGRSGELILVTVEHTITAGNVVAVLEEQDIIFRAASPGPAPPSEASGPAQTKPMPWREEFVATPPLLFRYSALTMNAHRIHYDLPYTREIEAYPGLVVHGPLLATMLAGFASRHARLAIAGFNFRATAPVFEGRCYRLVGGPSGKGAEVAVADSNTRSLVSAEISWRAGDATQ